MPCLHDGGDDDCPPLCWVLYGNRYSFRLRTKGPIAPRHLGRLIDAGAFDELAEDWRPHREAIEKELVDETRSESGPEAGSGGVE